MNNITIVEHPVRGEKVIFHRIGRDSEGEYLEAELIVKPHALGPPEHFHPNLEERLTVVSGLFQYRLNGANRYAVEGEHVTIPAGAHHTFWNDSEVECHLRGEIRPPMRFQTFIENEFGLGKAGKTNRRGLPNPLQAAVIFHEFRDEVQVSAAPIRVLLRLLAPVGRILGYKAIYPEFTSRESAISG